MSNGASHFKKRAIRKKVAAALRVELRFGVANSSWTNGKMKKFIREIRRTTKAI